MKKLLLPMIIPLVALLCMSESAVAARDAESGNKFPPMPVLAPDALSAYGANGRAYLDWNPAIEDERITGWQVYRSTDRRTWTQVNAKPLISPQFLDEKLDPAANYFYAVAAITSLGEDQRRSNLVAVNPRAVEDPKIVEGAMLTGADGKPVTLERKDALTIRWPDGQQLIYDKNHLRVRQWIAADGTPLMQTALYGNGVDLIGFNAYGMIESQEPSKDAPWLGRTMFTRDYTSPRRSTHPDSMQAFRGIEARDGCVTLATWLPLQVGGFRSFSYAQVWETWWPIERHIGGDLYRGLARSIEIKVPTHFNVEGYSLALNDGFGPNGSCDGGDQHRPPVGPAQPEHRHLDQEW